MVTKQKFDELKNAMRKLVQREHDVDLGLICCLRWPKPNEVTIDKKTGKIIFPLFLEMKERVTTRLMPFGEEVVEDEDEDEEEDMLCDVCEDVISEECEDCKEEHCADCCEA
jgi:hypothetical protein